MARKRTTFRLVDLENLETIPANIYELSMPEVEKARRLIYGINRDGIRRFRTLLDGPLLLVWRLK
jgi:hypothetical protein